MEVLNNHVNHHSFSPFASKFSTITRNISNHYKFRIPTSKFRKRPSFPCYSLLSNTTSLQVSAHFGRPTNRRNSLRKKLVNDPQVCQKNPTLSNSNFDLENTENLNNGNVENGESNYGVIGNGVFGKGGVKESKFKSIGESVMLSKLENWIDQYKKDVDYWGIGSSPIFTVIQDVEGNVMKVSVNEEEISKRSQVKFGNLNELKSRIMYAKNLAREMENGESVIPRNSSVAKFVISGEEAGFVNVIGGFIRWPEFIPKLSKVGRGVLLGLVVLWGVKKLFSLGKRNKAVEYTELEKEMMRRKMKSRKEREKELLEKEKVDVVEEVMEPLMVNFERPKINKLELMKNMVNAKSLKDDKSLLVDYSRSEVSESRKFDDKIEEIRAMARRAREIESRERSGVDDDGELSSEDKMVKTFEEDGVSFHEDGSGINGRVVTRSPDLENRLKEAFKESRREDSEVTQSTNQNSESSSHQASDTREANLPSDILIDKSCVPDTNSGKKKPRIIRSVKEAREFLSRKHDKPNFDQQYKPYHDGVIVPEELSEKESDTNATEILNVDDKASGPSISGGKSESMLAGRACSMPKNDGIVFVKKDDRECFNEGDLASADREGVTIDGKTESSKKTENWIEENFQDIEPIFRKMGDGYRDNFMVAKEKASQQVDSYADVATLGSVADDGELEWMKDDRLKEIVFQVRDNELAGRDPFYMMDVEDKHAFFQGLEKKVEKENEKLSHLHEWLHSNIENLDYGADGISVYDPLEKIIPRWKGPPLEKNPEFLDYFREQRESLFSGTTGTSYPMEKNEEKSIQNPRKNAAKSLSSGDLKNLCNRDPKSSKTIIEGSDGSVRPGKKSGKEFWQHTKKWSRGFLECYNAETDPEVKSIMKDMGKDLDRWITEDEVQEAADLVTKLPERNKKFMEKKLNKLKREMELFGPQAVVSKYREYAEDKEEDYLWWLDLPHVLCVELYTTDDGEQRIGLYSLEMAEDLELEPKPCHVIAFEDAGDCKNLCYIIQAHLEMLGNGHAFVVATPPKDAFREAKANGFGVTVIRKGELQLNADQTLEEVEEQIAEIGSKIYHDQIMKERSVDISSLMKGVFGISGKPTISKKTKRLLRRLSKKKTK